MGPILDKFFESIRAQLDALMEEVQLTMTDSFKKLSEEIYKFIDELRITQESIVWMLAGMFLIVIGLLQFAISGQRRRFSRSALLVMFTGFAAFLLGYQGEPSSLLRLLVIVIPVLAIMIMFWLTQTSKTLKREKTKYPRDSIIEILNKRKSKDVWTAATISFLSIVLSIFIPGLDASDMYFVRLVLFIVIIILLLGNLAFQYRIRQHWYGNNEREAREIIEFIIKESSNIDFRDGGKLKKILSDEDVEEIKSIVFRPVPGVTD